MQLLFATRNTHKLEEVKQVLPPGFDLRGLDGFDLPTELPETGSTLEENAIQKAEFVYERTGINCFAEDTGLEVEVLDNTPGIYSARYAGEPVDSNANMGLLLKNMEGKSNRNAKFRTIIVLILDGETHIFEGEVQGYITNQPAGTSGFGYDPVFIPEGYNITFAEMGNEVKTTISHRTQAMKKLIDFLENRKLTAS